MTAEEKAELFTLSLFLNIIFLSGCILTLGKQDASDIVNSGIDHAIEKADLPTLTHSAVTTTADSLDRIISHHIQDFRDSNIIYLVYIGAALLFLFVVFEVRRHLSEKKTHRLLEKKK